MKKVIYAILMLLVGATVALAEWKVDFRDTYNAQGIDKAVENALKDGKNPDSIVGVAIEIQDLNPQNLVKALYCAGASGQDIRAAAEKYKITEPIVAAGYKKSVDECGDRVADSQAYTTEGGASFATPSSTPPHTVVSRANFR